MISIAKAAADPTGHYSRPDVTRLWLNREPAPRVMEMSNGAAQQADVEVPAMSEQGGGCPVNEKKENA